MRDESPISFPNLSLSDPALAALRDFPAPLERSLPPYDPPQKFFERLLKPSTRSLFTGTFAALAARYCGRHLLTIVEPPSQSEVLADVVRLFPEETSPRFFNNNRRGCVILLQRQQAVIKTRYHAANLEGSIDPYAAVFDLFSDMTYESDISYLIWASSECRGHSFVASLLSQTIRQDKCSSLLATVYTSYKRLPGKPLDELLRTESLASFLKPWHIKRFVSDVHFTSFLRSHGLFNSDRKPGNIIVDLDGMSRYIDFEFVMTPQQFRQRTIHSDGKPWEGPGTIPFLAPERFALDHSNPYKADIFSLALVYVFGATGKHPFGVRAKDGSITVAHHICKGDVTEVSRNLLYQRVPSDVANVCISALDKNPHYRPTLNDFVQVARQYSDL